MKMKNKKLFTILKVFTVIIIMITGIALHRTPVHAASATSEGAYIDPNMYTFSHTVSFNSSVVNGRFKLYKHGAYMFELCTVSISGTAIASDGTPTGYYSGSTTGASDVTVVAGDFIFSYPPVKAVGNAFKDGSLVNSLVAQ